MTKHPAYRIHIPNIIFYLLVPIFFISPACANDQTIIQGTAVQVIDGDTVIIRPFKGKMFKCRLYGIDAPEIPVNSIPGQPFGRAADRELTNLIQNTTVHVTLTGDASYDRQICVVKRNGMDINREMIKRGYAWAYREFLKGPYISGYIEAEKEAREMKRGLWVQPNPVPPWEFRTRYR